MSDIIKLLIEGGKAKAGPQTAILASHKLDVNKVMDEINEKTKEFSGIQVPIEIIIDGNDFKINVGKPPTSQLIKKELGIEKLATTPWKTIEKEGEEAKPFEGDLKFEQVVKIAKMKFDTDLKKAVKQVIGTCLSCGVTVEGENPKDIQEEINSGKWDEKIK